MSRNISSSVLPREQWDTWDPMLISEGLFAAANIFRFVIQEFLNFGSIVQQLGTLLLLYMK